MDNVCIVTSFLPPNYGGADIAALHYAKTLSCTRKNNVILMGEWNSKIQEFYSKSLPFIVPISLKKIRSKKGYIHYIFTYINFFYTLLVVTYTIFKHRKNINIIHCFNSSSDICVSAILAGKILKKKTITETSLMNSDDPISLLKYKGFKRLAKVKWLKGRIFLLANHYISKSPYITAAYKATNLINRCTEVPYFIDTARFYPPSLDEKRALRHKHGIPAEATVIMFAGGINPRKGVHLLVEAFQQLLTSFPNIYLLLVGPTDKYDPEYPNKIQQCVNQIGQANARLVAENSTIVDEYMRAADIYCLPSFREGFPISNIEAMATGLIVVASDIPEIKNAQIRDGVNGLVFQTGSIASLTEVLQNILTNRDTYDHLTLNAAKEAKMKYDLSKIQERYLQIYHAIQS